MINLVNGRGQLGDYLRTNLPSVKIDKKVHIYHTWRPWQIDSATQKQEYEKFMEFVDKNKSDKIIFTSTYSQNETYYVHYKQLAESYLIANCKDSIIARLPSLIGNKGILKRLKEKSATPYGKIEFLPIATAGQKIFDLVQYNGIVKCFTLKGEEVSAELINELIIKMT
tara:strand:+ start:50 stop:556 length:507 start_codon:yes stop_codon:yes gene_type:complete